MEKHFCKISVDDAPFYLFTNMPFSLGKFKDSSMEGMDYFDVSLSNGRESYCGKVCLSDILKMSSLVDIEDEKYYNTLRKCLCKGDENTSVQFIYQLVENENDDSSMKFVWKQVLDEEMKFQLGSMYLVKEDNPTQKTLDIFSFLSQQLQSLTDEVAHLTKQNRNLELEKKGMTKRLEGYVHTKESLEQELFTKFALVLNEKKSRIRELKTKIDGGNNEIIDKPNKRKKGEKKEADEKEDAQHSGGDTDTDDEKERNAAKIKKVKMKEQKDDRLDIILEGNIIDEMEDMPKKNRKRIRTSKPKEPTALTLPRTSTLPRPPNPSSEASTSAVKKTKPKEITEDDLLDELMF